MIIGGNRSYIDQRYRKRSREEALLVDILDQCWIQKAEDRLSIFDVIQILEKFLHGT